MRNYDRKVFQLATSYCREVAVFDPRKAEKLATQIQEIINQFIEKERQKVSPSIPPA